MSIFDAVPLTTPMGDARYQRTATQPPEIVTLNAAGPVSLDAGTSSLFLIQLNGFAATSFEITNPVAGQVIRVTVEQGTPATSVTLPGSSTGYQWAGGDTNPPETASSAGGYSSFTVIYENAVFVELSRSIPTPAVIGVGTTAQRPAASAALTGKLYGNTQTETLQWCDGTTWHG